MIMKRRSTLLTGKVELANIDAFDALARDDRSTAMIPKGRLRAHPLTVLCRNPLIVWREGLSPGASNKHLKSYLNAVA